MQNRKIENLTNDLKNATDTIKILKQKYDEAIVIIKNKDQEIIKLQDQLKISNETIKNLQKQIIDLNKTINDCRFSLQEMQEYNTFLKISLEFLVS